MSSSFGQVIPVIGTLNGFLGEPSRTGGGDPFIVSKGANGNNTSNIAFGDTLALLPDAAGGTYRKFAEFLSRGGDVTVGLGAYANNSATVTPANAAATMPYIAPGMFITSAAAGIPAGAYVLSVTPTTFVLSVTPTANNASVNLFAAFFGGIAVREVKVQLGYPYSPTAGGQTGLYKAGERVGAQVKGSISVACLVGAPFAGSGVWLRCANNGATVAGVIGGLEAVPDTGNSVLLPAVPGIDMGWKSGAIDSNFVTEVTMLSRVAV